MTKQDKTQKFDKKDKRLYNTYGGINVGTRHPLSS
jgi:hypothetical protein